MLIRPQTRFGSLLLGASPKVVGTIATPAGLAMSTTGACHIVELRLDLLGVDTAVWMAAARRMEAQGQPVVVTLRLASEGGRWDQPDEARWPLFEAALGAVTTVDVEYRSPLLARVSRQACVQQRPLIISYHDFDKTPPLAELQQVIRSAANHGTVVKIATLTSTEADVATLRALFAEQCSASVCLLGMGPLGPRTRHEFPRLGSCLTYGYLDQPIAPGQVSARELMATLTGLRGA